ncbi:MAG: hypothetical protein ACRYFX_05270 [Janthinobacterium lividum]
MRLPMRCFYLLLAGLATACATTSGSLRLGPSPAAIPEMAFVSPLSFIVLDGSSRNHTTLDATEESERLLHQLVVRHRFQLRLQGEVLLPDSLRQPFGQEIFKAINGISRHERLGTRALLPTLDYLAATQPQRYLLVTAATGYTAGPPQFLSNAALLSYPQPVSHLYVLIYDREQQALVYYTASPHLAMGHEPLDAASLEAQFSQLLGPDFPLPH